MNTWNNLRTPPKWALKTIQAGRLRGMSDINPQWRYEVMTKQFGPCGIGWKYTIDRLWTEQGSKEQVMAFAQISLYIMKNNELDIDSENYTSQIWSDPIPAVGGSMAIADEKNGLHTSDECYKMAITDALGTAMKMIGVAADIYQGFSDPKFKDNADSETALKKLQNLSEETKDLLRQAGYKALTANEFCERFNYDEKIIKVEIKKVIGARNGTAQ